MNCSLYRLTWTALLLLSGLLPRAEAHNGHVALAYPLEGIAIDGDFSDWPEEMVRYPILISESGIDPVDAEDFQGTFRLGYSAAVNALYVAVEVRDQSTVIDTAGLDLPIDTQDGCDLYVDLAHAEENSPSVQYAVWGESLDAFSTFGALARLEDVELGMQRQGTSHRYEWRVDVGGMSGEQVRLRPGMSLGFDLFVWDQDADDGMSYMVWGRGVVKNGYEERRGDVVLMGTGEGIGRLRGQVKREDREEGAGRIKVRIRSLEAEGLWVYVETDQKGNYTAELPAGNYRLEVGRGSGKGVDAKIVANGETEAQLRAPRSPGRKVATWNSRSFRVGPVPQKGLWQTYSAASGRSFLGGLDILQDRAGYLWFGTWDGLGRYDGTHLLAFTTDTGSWRSRTTGSWRSRTVSAILEDLSGHLWFGTLAGGVNRYDGEQFTNFTTTDGLIDNMVLAILEDRSGHLWFGTDGGVSRYDGEQFTSFTTADGLAGNGVLSIIEDRQGHLWFGTGRLYAQGKGVSRYDGEQFQTFTFADGLAGNTVFAIFQDGEDHLWFGTTEGVSRYDGEQFTSFTTADGLADNTVRSIFQDSERHLWFGTTEGVSCYDGREFVNFTAEDGLVHNTVFAIFQDDENNLWFSTDDGVNRYDGLQLQTFTAKDGLAKGSLTSLVEDRAGNLWIAAVAGDRSVASRYNGKEFRTFTVDDGLPGSSVFSILEDEEGNLWFGTHWGGVSRYDGETFATFTTTDGLGHNTVYSIFQDSEHNLWFCTQSGGVSRYDGETFATFTTADGLGHNTVRSIFQDSEHNFWFGTDGGVSHYDGEMFTTFTTADGLGHNAVRSIFQDSDHNLWFGTEGGVSRYDGEMFATFTIDDGLADNVVFSILENARGHLWFGTDGGVSRYDGQVFQNLLARDGLTGNHVLDMLQDRNGDVWIAADKGLTRYRPSQTPPHIHLTKVVADRDYDPGLPIDLSSSQGYIAFEFQGRSLRTRPGQMVYLYRLEGYDEEWQQTRENRVEYGHLPRGDYVFQVKAVDRDLNHSDGPAQVELHVHLPYERFAWATALGIALLLTVWQTRRVVRRDRRLREANSALSAANKELFAVNRNLEESNRQIQEATQRKSEFLARMSHDLRTPMNAIIGYTRILLRRAKEVLDGRQYRNLESIHLSADHLLSLINDILDLSKVEAGRIDIKPEQIDLKRLAQECVVSVESLLKPGVELKQELADVTPVRTDADRLRRVLMNLLSNAVKFTETGSVTLSMRTANGGVEVAVADTGLGIPPEELPHIFDEFRQVERQGGGREEGTGLGLAIAKKSIELLGGEIEVESEVGQGTKFVLSVRDYSA